MRPNVGIEQHAPAHLVDLNQDGADEIVVVDMEYHEGAYQDLWFWNDKTFRSFPLGGDGV